MEKNINRLNIEKIGSDFEKHPSFPKGTNVEFVHIIDREAYVCQNMGGIGETMACSTGPVPLLQQR